MTALKVICDVDDVVCGLLPVWIGRYNRDYQQALNPDEVWDWDLTKVVIPECGKDIYRYLHDKSLYDEAPVIPGADIGVEAIRAAGHRVIFVTSCNADMAGRKYRWLQEHGFLPEHRDYCEDYIEASDKALIHGDVIIDDRVDTILKWAATGRYAILFKRAHNVNDPRVLGVGTSPLIYRADNWAGVLEALGEIERKVEKMYAVAAAIARGVDPAPAPSGDPNRPEDIATAGVKFDGDKPRYDLIPPEPLEQLAVLYAKGTEKYAERNWEKGMRWGRCYRAMTSHALKWWAAKLRGADGRDPETGVSHMVAAAWNAFALITYEERAIGSDDRPQLLGAAPAPAEAATGGGEDEEAA